MTVGQFLRSYWKDCVNDLKHPLNLLPTVLLAVIWIVLGWMAAKAKLALPLTALAAYLPLHLSAFLAMKRINKGAALNRVLGMTARHLAILSPEALRDFMAQTGIGMTVLTSTAPQPYFEDEAESVAVCRAMNRQCRRKAEKLYTATVSARITR